MTAIIATVTIRCVRCGDTILDGLSRSESDIAVAAPPQCPRCDSGHQPMDVFAFRQFGVDPFAVQPRERGVCCDVCGERTWHIAGRCALHYRAPAACKAALRVVPS